MNRSAYKADQSKFVNFYAVMIKKGIGVVGSTTIDKIVTGSRSRLKLGGVTTYSGITYRRQGINTVVVSNVAPKDLAILEKLRQENIVVVNGETRHTTRFVNYIKEDGRIQELLRRANPIDFRQITKAVDRVDALHLGPLHPLDIEPTAYQSLQHSRKAVFLDVQGCIRNTTNKKVHLNVSDHLAAALTAARIVKANGAEIKCMLDSYQMSLTELMGEFTIEEFIITSGRKGGFVQRPGGEKIFYNASHITTLVDPTGAGDVFFAAYIGARFAGNKPILDACRYAAHMAAQQVEGKFIGSERLGLS